MKPHIKGSGMSDESDSKSVVIQFGMSWENTKLKASNADSIVASPLTETPRSKKVMDIIVNTIVGSSTNRNLEVMSNVRPTMRSARPRISPDRENTTKHRIFHRSSENNVRRKRRKMRTVPLVSTIQTRR